MSMTSPTTMDLAEIDPSQSREIDREVAALTDDLRHRVSDMEVAVTLEGRRQALVDARRLAVVKERAQLRQQQREEAASARDRFAAAGTGLPAAAARAGGGPRCLDRRRCATLTRTTARPPGGSARSTARSAHRRCGANCTCRAVQPDRGDRRIDRTRPREGRRAAGRPVAPRPRVVGDDRELRQSSAHADSSTKPASGCRPRRTPTTT